MKDKSASEMLAVAVKTLKGIEVKTMTYDNSTENTKHEEINKILRQFFQKGTNFNLISEEQINKIQKMANNRTIKLLGWNSPAGLFSPFRSGY